MIHTKFEYKAPRNLKKAVELLSMKNAFAISGGTKIMNAVRSKRITPALLVDLKNIRDLKGISLKKSDGFLTIRSYTSLSEIAESPKIKKYFPLLAEAVNSINDPQYKNMATIGGSVAYNARSSDIIAALLVLNATVNVTGENGERKVSMDNLFSKAYETCLTASEIILSFDIPLMNQGTKSAYIKFKNPADESAICGVAAVIEVKEGRAENCRFALTGATECTTRLKKVEEALIGNPLIKENIEKALSQIKEESLVFIDDISASSGYRKHLAEVLTERVIQKIS